MKKLCGFFLFLFLISSAFATTIYTEEKAVYGPIGGGYNLNSVRANSVRLGQNQLLMEVELEWESWINPRGRGPNYHQQKADLAFNDVVYNKGTKELFYQDQRIARVKKKCWFLGCYEKLVFDHDYELFVSHDGFGFSVDVVGGLRLLDGK